jgi:transposase
VAHDRLNLYKGASARRGLERRERGHSPHKKGHNTKIHVAVDSAGSPLGVHVTEGTVVDCTETLSLIEGFKAGHLLADKGYDSDAIVVAAEKAGISPTIPPRSNRRVQRVCDRCVYRMRHLIENAFLKMK